MADSSRDRMLKEVQQGAVGGPVVENAARDKTLLIRGCDPVMAQKAAGFLPPLIGNPKLLTATDDERFVELLKEGKYDAVCFAPGACRWDAAKKPIPGGNAETEGWGLAEYRELVRKHQGEGIPIVETTEEKEMVDRLRQALGV